MKYSTFVALAALSTISLFAPKAHAARIPADGTTFRTFFSPSNSCVVTRTADGSAALECTYNDVGVAATCPTCTPGYLSYKNAIGMAVLSRGARAGAGSAVTLCDGPCVSRQSGAMHTTEGTTMPG